MNWWGLKKTCASSLDQKTVNLSQDTDKTITDCDDNKHSDSKLVEAEDIVDDASETNVCSTSIEATIVKDVSDEGMSSRTEVKPPPQQNKRCKPTEWNECLKAVENILDRLHA